MYLLKEDLKWKDKNACHVSTSYSFPFRMAATSLLQNKTEYVIKYKQNSVQNFATHKIQAESLSIWYSLKLFSYFHECLGTSTLNVFIKSQVYLWFSLIKILKCYFEKIQFSKWYRNRCWLQEPISL